MSGVMGGRSPQLTGRGSLGQVSAKMPAQIHRTETPAEPTFEVDGRVRILLESGGNRLLNLFLVVVALNVVAVLIDQRRVAVDDRSLVSGVICDLFVCLVSSVCQTVRTQGCVAAGVTHLLVCLRAHRRRKSALADKPRPLLQLVAAVRAVVDRRVRVRVCHNKIVRLATIDQ
jgi:uncharacterized membrane protein (UPF0136 family)